MHLTNPDDLQMQAGDSDDIIQFLKHQAERGDVESQVRSLHTNMNVSAISEVVCIFSLLLNQLQKSALTFSSLLT